MHPDGPNRVSGVQAAVEGQLAERQEQKKLETALRLQEERGMSAAMAAELKDKMEVTHPLSTLT